MHVITKAQTICFHEHDQGWALKRVLLRCAGSPHKTVGIFFRLPSEMLPRSGREDALQTDAPSQVESLIPYVLVNPISNQAYAFLAAAEIAAEAKFDLQGATDVGETTNLTDPRNLDSNTPNHLLSPPKKFYRLFWRSITARVLAHRMDASIMHE